MSLTEELATRIAVSGPITVAEFMTAALLHPEHGYYATRDPLGTDGDFITSPEISQMFGEVIGLSLAQSWLDQGSPSPFTLVELGPGRGTLMADILRATTRVPGFHESAQIVLIEASPVLKAKQAETLATYDPTWRGSVTDLPDEPLWLVANEFFDALPVRQFQRDGAGWRERCVGLLDGTLAFGLSPVGPQPALDHRLEDTKDGDLVEWNAPASATVTEIGARISERGGAALIIDYGDWRSLGDTLQALRGHAAADPLDAPGAADLTTHVDFEALVQGLPCAFTRLTPQGVFLERLGITARAQSLAQAANTATRAQITAAHRRLTHPSEMGTLFKIVGLFPDGQPPPPGLET